MTFVVAAKNYIKKNKPAIDQLVDNTGFIFMLYSIRVLLWVVFSFTGMVFAVTNDFSTLERILLVLLTFLLALIYEHKLSAEIPKRMKVVKKISVSLTEELMNIF